MELQSPVQEIISVPIENGETVNSHFFQRQVRWIMVMALVISDLAGLLLGIIIAIGLRTVFLGGFNIEPYYRIFPLLLIFPLFYVMQNLYPAVGIGPVDELRRLTISTSLGFITFIIVLYLMYIPQVFSRTIFILGWAFALGFIPLARLLTRKLLIKLGYWGEPVAVFGPPELNQAAITHLINNPSIGMRPVLNLVPENEDNNVIDVGKGLQKSLVSICMDKNVQCAILTDKSQSLWGGTRLDLIEDNFERVVWIDIANDQPFLWVKFMELGGMAGIEKKHELAKPGARTQKQLFDLIGSLLLLVLLSPFFLVIAIIIKFTSKGAVLYKQTRIGKGGQSFQMLKFRTMYKDADQKLDEYLSSNAILQNEWDSYQKLKDDPRITPVGRILRLYSIDEMPQLWNVFKGEMSLVGPRPFMPEQENLHADTIHHYIRLRPGLTGMWQVYGRNDVSYEFRIRMDEYYFRNWSIWLDIFILIRTPWVVIRRLGAY